MKRWRTACLVAAIAAAAAPITRADPGDLDPTFGFGGGIAYSPSSACGTEGARALVLQPDGKLVAGGLPFVLARFDSSGTLDSSFGGGSGYITTPIGDGSPGLDEVALQPDGKLVAAGGATVGADGDIALVRHNSDGTLDMGFGSGGIVTGPVLPGDQAATGLAIQSDGKLVAAAESGGSDFIVVRYNADGSLDTGFGSAGVASITVGTGAVATSLIVQPDGMLVAAGYVVSTDAVAVLARFDAGGSPDPGFGTAGVAMGPSETTAKDLLVTPGGQLVVAGGANNFENFAVIQWQANGTLDGGFGTGGLATVLGNTNGAEAQAVVREPNGGLIVAGQVVLSLLDMRSAVARVDASGTLDSDFGTDGIVYVTSFGFPAELYALVRQPDGKVVAAGSMYLPDEFGILLARLAGSTECGNGIVEPGELCDDANTAGNDCCTPACELPSCRAAGKSLMVIKDNANDQRDKLVWKWLKGDATTLAELGDPTDSTSYTLCLYAGTAAFATVAIPPDAAKWSAIGTSGFKYSDPGGSAGGVYKALLKSGAAGRAKALVKGKGPGLPDGLLPVADLPLEVRLVNGDGGACFGATFDMGDVIESGDTQFRAKAE